MDRRISARKKIQPRTIYDEAAAAAAAESSDNNKRKRRITTSKITIARRRTTAETSNPATTVSDLDREEEDFTSDAYKLNMGDKTDKEKVKETLRVYNAYYLRFAQLEERRCGRETKDSPKGSKPKPELEERRCGREPKDAPKGSKPKPELEERRCGRESKHSPKGSKKKPEEKDEKKKSARPDLKTLSQMKKTKTILFPQKQIGSVPGIDVGDHFLTRCELSVVGLHNHHQSGIDYISKGYEKVEKYENYTFPIAVSVVLSGKYEDNIDKGDEVIYCGQGANDLKGNSRQMHDQEEKAPGNMALKNSCDQDVPVRLIRGHEPNGGKTGTTYTYDGLYKVVEYWVEKGGSQFNVLKFQLIRLEGQPPLTSKQVAFSRKNRPKITDFPGLVCKDISRGAEAIPIPVTNVIDYPVEATGFQYRKSMQLAKNVKLPVRTSGCGCEKTCTDPTICDCAKLNGVDFPYVSKGDRLVVAKSVVYECGPLCGCESRCANRSSQRGIKYRFEVYRTPDKGWAVRSHDFIPIGAPVCEYIGVVRRTKDVKNTDDADYMFDIDTFLTMHGIDDREQRIGDAAKSSSSLTESEKKKLKSKPQYCIDGSKYGNVARFINHSCDGNLFVQSVLSCHQDSSLARVILFASENIPPLKELTYDYGYAVGCVLDADGNERVIECHCRKKHCRGRVC